jgi:cyclic 2,3-diphosphoglycerate synthase
LVVVDGEHYPPVVEAALSDLVSSGHEVAAAILVGGREKLPKGGVEAYGDVEVRTGESARDVLDEAILELEPEAVLDFSDEPVLDYRRRHQLAAVALVRGVPYEGADFRFTPPPRPRVCEHPSIAVIGTGKRTGKTAVAGFSARALVAGGHRPVIVAMGRGGPPEPQVLRGDEVELKPADLLELAASGQHAASDYVEDALLGRVPTVGCRRCGGGLAGAVDVSNVADGVRLANDLPGDMILLEGSGSAIPPVHADVTGLIVPASIPLEYITGYMGPYRLLLSDFVVVTMCEEPFGSPSQISAITSEIQAAFRSSRGKGVPQEEIRVVRTVFRPSPTQSVEGKKAFVATTAPREAADGITRHLEEEHGCEVVGMSHSLSDRERLEEEIANIADTADVLLVEIKAAGIDVATKKAIDEDLEVIYMDNVPHSIDDEETAALVQWAGDLATERFESR